MFGSYKMTIGASVERTVLSEVSKVVALDTEGFSAVICWCIFKGYEERKCIELVEGMYDARLYRDFCTFDFLIGFEVYGLAE